MRIRVYHMPRSKQGEYHLVYGEWPESSIRSRGWGSADLLYQRPATPDEIQEQAASARHLCYRYRAFEALARDEARYGIDAARCVQARVVAHLDAVTIPAAEIA